MSARTDRAVRTICILRGADYRPGDPAPEGYLQWHEWAEVQYKAGLRQKECGRCGKWKFPQQLSDQFLRSEAKTTRGKTVKLIAHICLDCAAASGDHHG